MTESLQQRLSLVLPSPEQAKDTTLRAFAAGEAIAVDAAIERAAAMLRDSKAPAVTGAHRLSCQAVRQAVALMRQHDGAMRIDAPPIDHPVMHTASLGHVTACDFIIKPGPGDWAATHPVAAYVAQHVLHSLFVPPGLDELLALRQRVRERGGKAITDITMRPAKRLAVLLPPETRSEIISQWHKLAAELQTGIRTCVMALPDIDRYYNTRGALEVIAHLTGAYGGFGHRRVPDLAIDCGERSNAPQRIVIGTADETADLCFVTPGLAMGLAAQVVRFDGIPLWLCDDPVAAPPDPAAELLRRWRDG
jgi:hypothetical protein